MVKLSCLGEVIIIDKAIIIFTRVPEGGHTKTRMMPYMDENQCESLHRCFLKDISVQISHINGDVFVFYTSFDRSEKELIDVFGDVEYIEQNGDDIGSRMLNAIEEVKNRGYKKIILIGTDIPELGFKSIDRAFDEFEKNDIVFGRTFDGGYYLVGMKEVIDDVFHIEKYGHNHVFEDTINHLLGKYDIGFTDTLHDMDNREDLEELYIRLVSEDGYTPSHTFEFIKKNIPLVSIVVPVYNEKTTISNLLLQLDNIHGAEVIFVDGGSKDDTKKIISSWISEKESRCEYSRYRLISSDKGRANQMNAGAEISRGEILFFLHCDSVLPENFVEQIRSVMKSYSLGCFGIDFDSNHPFMYTNKWISNHRAKHRRIIFGDQGIFLKKDLFYSVGGFENIPIMEDYKFSLDLKKKGIKVGMTKDRIITSHRRYPSGTIPKMKVMWNMFWLRRLYRHGVDIEEISRRYRDIR